ncbi:MAG: hypothetical protein A2169_09995 [Deltaproteobacteria bacterium RBG_13_47_9]|nr:MAG: hypothetical protein A2169_09995 [Deltaproteobacteria bacterium RBG_13_47_9]
MTLGLSPFWLWVPRLIMASLLSACSTYDKGMQNEGHSANAKPDIFYMRGPTFLWMTSSTLF